MVVVNPPKNTVGQPIETIVYDLGNGNFLTRQVNYATGEGLNLPAPTVYGSGGGSNYSETLVSSSIAPPDEVARQELATQIANEEQQQAQSSGYTDVNQNPLRFKQDINNGETISTTLTAPRTQQEVANNLYDVHKNYTLSESTPFTTRVGDTFVQIIPNKMEVLDKNGNVTTVGALYKPTDFQIPVYSAMVGQPPVAPSFPSVMDLTGLQRQSTIESLSYGRPYNYQNPKGTISGQYTLDQIVAPSGQVYQSNINVPFTDITLLSGTYQKSIQQEAQDLGFNRWYGGLSESEKWWFEAEVVAGTTLLTLPLMSAGISTLPRVIQLGVAWGSSAYMSYDIIKGTEKEGLKYLTRPQFVVGVPLAIASGFVGYKLASSVGIAGKFELPQKIFAKQSIIGIEEIGGKGSGLFRGTVEIKTDIGATGWRSILYGSKQTLTQNIDVMVAGENFKVPIMKGVNLPIVNKGGTISFGGKFAPTFIGQEGVSNIAILGGSQTITSRGFFGGIKTRTIPMSAYQTQSALFGQAEGTVEYPTFTTKARYTEFASPKTVEKYYGRVLDQTYDIPNTNLGIKTSIGLSRGVQGKFDIYTISRGTAITSPAFDETLFRTPFKPYFEPPSNNVYIGVGELSNRPFSVSTFNKAIGTTNPKVNIVTKAFGEAPSTSAHMVFAQQKTVLTGEQVRTTLLGRSFARPMSAIRTTVFDFLPKLVYPVKTTTIGSVFKLGEIQEQGQIQIPKTITQQSQRLVFPTLTLYKPKKDNGLIYDTQTIVIGGQEKAKAPIQEIGQPQITIQKQRQVAMVGVPIYPRFKVPFVPLPFTLPTITGKKGIFGKSIVNLSPKYQPTLIAKTFKIYGKQPSIVTGMEPWRPMVRIGKKKKSKRR